MHNYLNILHFCIYVFIFKINIFLYKINPFYYLLKWLFFKGRYAKFEIPIGELYYNEYGNKYYFGPSVGRAGGILSGLIGFFFFALLLLLNIDVSNFDIAGCFILSYIICYLFIFRKNKYVSYFNKYDKWSKVEKRKYSALTFVSVIAVPILFCLGLNN